VKIVIDRLDFTEVWDGVLYKKLANYPHWSAWELSNLSDFIAYEASLGRICTLECHADVDRDALLQDLQNFHRSRFDLLPQRIEECTACLHQGCLTDWVCHTASVENAIKILSCGSLLSAVRARGIPAAELMQEPRNAARDPEDYFHYVMFAWGNCQAGDRLVTERSLGRFPTQEELEHALVPGIRFYSRYPHLVQHPHAAFDGVLPVKVKDEVILLDWIDAIVIPSEFESQIMPYVPEDLLDRCIFLDRENRGLWFWSKALYDHLVAVKG